MTWHKIIFGDARNMKEVPDRSVHLVVTSPPYYNAPFDFPGLFSDYEEYLDLLEAVGREIYRVLAEGRVACFVVQDIRINKKLYPIVADLIHIMLDIGFNYRDKIIWRKPEGYIRISRRSGVLIQNPYPMYFYPDNIYEEIVIFQKGEFDYKKIPQTLKERSRINIQEFQDKKWYLSVWDITNVLPSRKDSKFTAVFPDEIPYRLIKLFSYVEETVLDPFLGTGTTTRVARILQRNSIGYEIDLELAEIIKEKIGYKQATLEGNDTIEIIIRDDAKRLRTQLRREIERKLKRKNRRAKVKK